MKEDGKGGIKNQKLDLIRNQKIILITEVCRVVQYSLNESYFREIATSETSASFNFMKNKKKECQTQFFRISAS